MKNELNWSRLETEDGEYVGRIAVTPDKKLVIIETERKKK